MKEHGPVRASLNISGKLTLQNRQGNVELLVDCDYLFYTGRSEIHIRPMLLGAITDATVLNDWSFLLYFNNGKQLAYGGSDALVRYDPNHENMTWRGLQYGWVSWRLIGDSQLTFWSQDFMRHQNGFVNTQVLDRDRKRLALKIGRIEPYWGYQDVNNPAKPIIIYRGSWRRWDAVFGLSQSHVHPETMVRCWRSPLRGHLMKERYPRALTPWLEGKSVNTRLREKVAQKCEDFVCQEPEYTGSLHGGWDGPNHTYIERTVLRGEFGEYLFHEFFRTEEWRFYKIAFDFGQVYRDLNCFTIEEAADDHRELGAARNRQVEYLTCPVRSYRGAVLLAYMYQETGDERYLDALRKRANYHLANYPHYCGRLSMSTRDSVYMPMSIPEGRWFMRDFMNTTNASPEMTAYNIIGWYGLCLLFDPGPAIMRKIKKVCDWFRDHQNDDGSWPYPHDNSATKWGHGSLQDAMAMLYAFKLFQDPSYLQSAKKSIAFTKRTFEEYSRVPLLLGLLPHQETENSLTYYYGIETLAVYNEILQSENQKKSC